MIALKAFLGLVLSSLAYVSQAAPASLIESITVKKNNLTIKANKAFKAKYLKDDFFAEYDADIDLEKLDPSLVILPFLLNVIPIVWLSGETYVIDSLDEDIYFALKKVKKVLKRTLQKTSWKGNVKPLKLVKNRPITPLKDPKKEVALLFSGGLDSTASSFHHRDKKQLLITLWGQWDVPLTDAKLWSQRKHDLQAFAQTYGHTSAFVRSNYTAFLNWNLLNKLSPEITSWRVDTTEGMGMMGLAAPLMLLKGYSTLVIGSSFTWQFPYATAANPFVDNNLLFAGNFRALHDLFDCERIDKLRLIANAVRESGCPYPFIKACSLQRATNCNCCTKCVPTTMALLALGEDPKNYGFMVSPQEATKHAQKFLSTKQCLDGIWPLTCVKKELQKKSLAGEVLPDSVAWLLKRNLEKQCCMELYAPCTPIDWSIMKDLCPPGIVMPSS